VALLDDSNNASLGNASEEDVPNNSPRSAISLKSLDFVAKHLPFVEDARTKVTEEMESMVLTGLTTLVRATMTL
jgi:conserved oligomeric Golgi complex subunit 5